MRYYYSMSNGCDAEQLATLRTASVPTAALEKDKSTFLRLERGSVLHNRGCDKLSGKRTVVEHLSILEVGEKSVHSSCTRWRNMWKSETIKAAGQALYVAELVNETNDLKGRSEPAFARLARLLAEARAEDTFDAFRDTYGGSVQYDQVLKDLLTLETAWASSDSGTRAAACVVQTLTCPRRTVRLLGADHDKAWRLASAGWEAWQKAVSEEKSLAVAHAEAVTAIEHAVKQLRKHGEDVRDDETAGIRALTKSWEKTLQGAASSSEGEVLLAVKGGNYMYPNSPLARAAAAFPSARGTSGAALRCPAQVADWISDNLDRWQSKHLHVLGVATEKDTKAVLETLVAVWDPAGSGDAADVRKALQAARTLTG